MAHPGHHAAAQPEAAAIVMAETGETVTSAGLHRRAVQAANALHDAGLRPGDPVAFCLENRPDFAVLVWACQYAGFRYTPISTRLTEEEIADIAADCGATVFLHSIRTAHAAAAARRAGAARTIIDVDTPGALGRDLAAEPRYPRAEGITMLYSSGTTGRPKGVLRPAPPEPIETVPPGDALLGALYGFGPGAVYLSPAPLYHSAPLTFLLQMGRLGATTVVLDRFDPETALAHMEHYGVTHSQWVPTMFVRLLRLPAELRATFDLSAHRFAIHGAGPCPVAVKEAMLDWWGPIIHEYYAGTEGAGMCLIGPEEWIAHKGSVGRSIRGPIHILDEAGNPLPAGDIGQVWFASGAEFRYLGDDAKTAEARNADGRASFGDIGYLDADGYLYLTDRKSFTVNVGGINVYPREIEDVLATHPAVADAVVFGIPNEEYGEEVKAVVQPLDGTAGGASLEHELLAHCRAHLAVYKVPRSVDFVAEMPREPTGKLRTGLLRQRYLRG